VRKREFVRLVAANAVHLRSAPIFRADSPGSEPSSGGMAQTTGKTIHPLRALLDGVR
jgi:hypothetical protein